MLSIDVLIVVTYLIFTLYIGIKYGRGTNTIEMFATGGRNFNTATLAATLAATYISGSSFIIGIQYAYMDGILDILAGTFGVIAMILASYILIPRMKEFLGKYSVADALGDLYGKQVQIVVALSGVMLSIGFIALQIKILSATFAYFTDVSVEISVLISAAVFIFYSMFGGIKAVAITDLMQFITFIIVVPIIAITISHKVDFINNSETAAAALSHIFEFKSHSGTDYVTLALVALIPGTNPPIFHRMIIGRNIKQVRSAYHSAAMIYFFYITIAAIVGIMLFSYNPNTAPSDLFGVIVAEFTPSGVKGLLVIAVIAMAMSTADSYLNSSSVMISHDVLEPLGLIKTEKQQLFFAKLFILIIGSLSIISALYFKGLMDLLLFTKNLYEPIVSVPLIFTILGFRTSTRAILFSMFAGFFTVLLWKWKLTEITGFDSLIPAMVANALVLFATHYLLDSSEANGWVGPKDRVPLDSMANERRENINYIKTKFTDIWSAFLTPNLKTLKMNSSPVMYLCLSAILAISYISVTMTTKICVTEKYSLLMQVFIFLISSLLFSKSLWERYVSENLSSNFVLFSLFVLIFSSGQTMFNYGFASISVISLMANIMVVAFFVDVITATMIGIIGILFSYACFTFLHGDLVYNTYLSPISLLIYLGLMVSIIIFTFLRGQQNQIIKLENDKNALQRLTEMLNSKVEAREINLKKALDIHADILRNINHEIKTPMSTLISNIDMLVEAKTNPVFAKEMPKIIDGVASSVDRFFSYASNLIDLSAYQTNKMLFDIKSGNLKSLLLEFSEASPNILLSYSNDVSTIVEFDEVKMRQVFKNIIDNGIKYGEGSDLEISVSNYPDIRYDSRDYKAIKIIVKDSGIGIPPEELEKIFEPFELSSRTFDGSGGRGLGLTIVREIITSHSGSISAFNNPGKGVSIQILLPLIQPKGKFLAGDILPQEEIIDLRQIILDVKKIEERHNNRIPKILMIDDDMHVLSAGKLIIKGLGYDFIGIATGDAAEEFINSDEFDAQLVLLDMMLGSTTGLAVMTNVGDKLNKLGIPVIVQSGLSPNDRTIVETLKLGAREFMGKPYSRKEIADIIKKYLG